MNKWLEPQGSVYWTPSHPWPRGNAKRLLRETWVSVVPSVHGYRPRHGLLSVTIATLVHDANGRVKTRGTARFSSSFFSFYILFILLVESYGPVNHKKHVAGGSSYGLNFKSVNIFIF